MIGGLTGLALIPALLAPMESMFAARENRDPIILTFLATGSGMTSFGLGSAFLGLDAGFVALGAEALLRRRKLPPREGGSIIRWVVTER